MYNVDVHVVHVQVVYMFNIDVVHVKQKCTLFYDHIQISARWNKKNTENQEQEQKFTGSDSLYLPLWLGSHFKPRIWGVSGPSLDGSMYKQDSNVFWPARFAERVTYCLMCKYHRNISRGLF